MNTKEHFVEPCSHRVSNSAVCHILYIHHRSHKGPLFLRILAHSSSTEPFFLPKTYIFRNYKILWERDTGEINFRVTDRQVGTEQWSKKSSLSRILYVCMHAHTQFLCAYFLSTVWPSLTSFVASLDKKCDLHDVTSLIKIWLCIAVLCWLNCCIFFQREKSFYILITHNKFPHCLY